ARDTHLVGCRAAVADQDGFIYIADDGSRTVRRIDPATGIATVIAGGGTLVDDLVPIPARSAYLNSPMSLAIGAGKSVYIVDDANHRVRLLSPSGLLTTVAGNGTPGFSGDGGAAARAQFNTPTGIALHSSGTLYITDRLNRAIRKIDPATGAITTIAGGPGATGTGDGISARDAALRAPWGIAVDGAGNIFFADVEDHVVRRIDAASGLIRTVAGIAGTPGNTGDGGAATAATLNSPQGVAVASNGDLYIGHVGYARRVSVATGVITRLLGGGFLPLADGQPGTDVVIPDGIGSVSLASNSALLLALTGDNVIARLDLSTGIFTIVAGDPIQVRDGGPAATAPVAAPGKLALDSTGNLYIADTFHHRLRRVTPGNGGVASGTIASAAGSGNIVYSPDGTAAAGAPIVFPQAIFAAPNQELYYSDNQSAVRRIGADGRLRTVAGQPFPPGYGGDGSAASAALVNRPQAVAVDTTGNVYIADTVNHRIRRVDSAGII
ncbi:MAG: hypothetical protein ACREE7_17500, partial [Dongiaceae bacterium]